MERYDFIGKAKQNNRTLIKNAEPMDSVELRYASVPSYIMHLVLAGFNPVKICFKSVRIIAGIEKGVARYFTGFVVDVTLNKMV